MNSTVFNIESYFDRLWPICRSISGNGLRDSFKILSEIIPLTLHEIPTGTKVFDWEIPKEWNINDAWIEAPDGKRFAEFSKNNLHVFNYSIPVNKQISFEEMEKHIKTIPDMPDAIPYVTTYYNENWGFCISQNEFDKLPKVGTYKVFIDSSLSYGSLTYGEVIIPGETDQEILISTYLCHPSMAINELSGPLVAAFLYLKMMDSKIKRRFTYRFIFAPETIGVIGFLSKKGFHLKEKLVAGYVITCVGHPDKLNYKKSKRGNSLADKTAEHVLKYCKIPYSIRNFSVGGSDERQYCSAGFNLPVGSLMRTPYKEYKEYHTSADNKSIVSFEAMEKTISVYHEIIEVLELNQYYSVTEPYCELQLGKRGLYPPPGGKGKIDNETHNLLHFLSYADGSLDLIDIAEKAGIPVRDLKSIIHNCFAQGLIYIKQFSVKNSG